MTELYAQVIVPLPLAGTFTYIVPESMADTLGVGMRVVVPFGTRLFYTGIVASLSPVKPEGSFRLKPIAQCLDTRPTVRPGQIRFWEWMADYYLCSIGEVYKAALPTGMTIESETRVEIVDDFDAAEVAGCTSDEMQVLEFLKEKGTVAVSALSKQFKGIDIPAIINRLVDRRLVIVSERHAERFRVMRRPYVRVTVERSEAGMATAFGALRRKSKQEEALIALLALSEFNRTDRPLVEVPLDVLLERADVQRPIVKALADKGICEIFNKEISRFSYSGTGTGVLPVLTDVQQKAFDGIMRCFNEKAITLLHGVTGSGKTEIYIHLIDYALKNGKNVLYVVPEIALTTQLTSRLQKVFGEKVMVYHSKFSDNERVEMWRRLLAGREPMVVVGARSSVFLPFSSLGLVIVDEEHDSSFKQYDPAPRYNGRDAAAMLAQMHGAKTLYGSATPSIETYYKALEGRFGLVSLTERYEGVAMPEIEIVDMRAARRGRAVTGILSKRLLDATLDVTSKGKQAILFHNRRGYAPMARCSMCGFTPKCDFCDVSLTYHKGSNNLHCHYCGTQYPVPAVCPECKEPQIEIVGWGTERLEEDIAELFEKRRVLRMDLDTTRNKDGHAKIIDAFSSHKADILVGTQMVTKGLDFSDVDLVGVLSADKLINIPDFRSAERAFNMIEQVAGRAGRRDGKGRVFVQAYDTSHPLLHFAAAHDYEGFYRHEVEERRAFNFPPFSRIINIYLKHVHADVARRHAQTFAALLRQSFGTRVFGPREPQVARVQNQYIFTIMLKVEAEASMKKVKEILRGRYVELMSSPTVSGLTVYYDVDPA
ncbi:MAG: primosomal protein N' [Muribaculaceae bacterium]|nr:primosomal protein N' [Muribaculaceae bacterium]